MHDALEAHSHPRCSVKLVLHVTMHVGLHHAGPSKKKAREGASTPATDKSHTTEQGDGRPDNEPSGNGGAQHGEQPAAHAKKQKKAKQDGTSNDESNTADAAGGQKQKGKKAIKQQQQQQEETVQQEQQTSASGGAQTGTGEVKVKKSKNKFKQHLDGAPAGAATTQTTVKASGKPVQPAQHVKEAQAAKASTAAKLPSEDKQQHQEKHEPAQKQANNTKQQGDSGKQAKQIKKRPQEEQEQPSTSQQQQQQQQQPKQQQPSKKQKQEQQQKQQPKQKQQDPKSAQVASPEPITTGAAGSGLLDKMRARLQGGRFRFLNEALYTRSGDDAFDMMQKDPSLFNQYHEGFRQQTKGWPKQPVDQAIAWLASKPADMVVADFGCGDGKLGLVAKQVGYAQAGIQVHMLLALLWCVGCTCI